MRAGLVCAACVLACGQPANGVTTKETTPATETGAGTGAPTTAGPTTGGPGEATSATAATSAASTSAASTSDGTTTGGPQQDLVEVSHAREFRAVWVATVGNINFPGAQEVDPAGQIAELTGILDATASAGFNAVVFQVRPEGDALYASTLEPWSRYLTGTQGTDPGYDPLASAIELAHARGLELHAWFNPYRAKANKGSTAAANHMSEVYPQYAYEYEPALWMDPGAAPVQDLLDAVIADVVKRYDVDGIHFDDYFYPYPNGNPFPDGATYQAYVDGGGALDKGDWRRDNVNRMVARVYATVTAIDPMVRFGISPFGIYRPGMPPGIEGLDQYAEIYADPLQWMQAGTVDYLAPQLYWPSTQEPQAYGALIAWWSANASGGRHIFAGNYLSKLGSSDAWTLDEFRAQITLSRSFAAQGSRGNIYFHVGPILTNQNGVADVLRAEFYATPALTPPMAAQAGATVEPPQVELVGQSVSLGHADVAGLRAWVVYRQEGQGWAIDRVVPVAQASIPLSSGAWAVSAAGRHGVESAGVRVIVP
ncbi:MAG: family 10 glycosylhydrolase [Myxococcales bacterium]|nr:family 10 glycosylhydrolase [Myxococcales bacterium]